MTEAKELDLKPCPFCGAAAMLSDIGGGDWSIICSGKCPAWPSVLRGGQAAAVDAWNTRAPDPEILSLREIVREVAGVVKPFAYDPANYGKHTPGPWKWETSIYEHMGAGIRSIPDDRGIAQVWQHPNVVADAALLAAAPTMREALTAIDEAIARVALSTAPVALGAGWNTDLDAMPHALTLLFKAHDPDEPEGVVSLGIRGEEPQRLIAWSFLPSAIHPAPSREAVIDRAAIIEECARVADEHAQTWGAAMGSPAKVIAAAIRSLPSNAPSLGEARLAEGEPVFTYTRTFNAIAAAVEWKPNNAFGISVRKFVEAFGPNPSHVQAEAGEARC